MELNLFLKNLVLLNFKNYETVSIDFSPILNCLVGNNGMGKTNLLDAIHLICMGKSHFMASDQNLVRIGEPFYRVQAKFERENKQEEIVAKYKIRGPKVFERNKSPLSTFRRSCWLITARYYCSK